MALAKRVMGGGFSAGQALALGGGINSAVSAAGSSQTDATTINSSVNYLSTVGSGAGVILPACQPGDSVKIYNGGANPATIYPHSGGKINGQATNGGISLATATEIVLTLYTATQWVGHLSA